MTLRLLVEQDQSIIEECLLVCCAFRPLNLSNLLEELFKCAIRAFFATVACRRVSRAPGQRLGSLSSCPVSLGWTVARSVVPSSVEIELSSYGNEWWVVAGGGGLGRAVTVGNVLPGTN